MEIEVNALMGADDEAIWNRARLFTSIDGLSVGSCGKLKKVSNAELISEPSFATRGRPVSLTLEPSSPFPGGSYPHQKYFTMHYVGLHDTPGRLFQPRSSGGRVHIAQGGKGLSLEAWKPNRSKRMMVLGSEIGLEESCNLALYALVGHLSY